MTDAFIDLVDPELRGSALAMRENMAAYTPMDEGKLAQRRAWMASIQLVPFDHVPYEEVTIARPAGCGEGPDVTALVVNPRPGAHGPGILHMHGGGYTASTALAGLRNVQTLAAELDCPIVTVDYRLAPETTWSGSLGDNSAAMLWLRANGAAVGVDPSRIALLGESAGGGHAALLALAMRARGEAPAAFQALVYPMLDDRAGTSRAPAEHVGYFGWNPEANRFGWRSFLGCDPGGEAVPAGAVPARVADLSGLPPTWIGVGALDLFVDECIEFAARLNHARVPTELLVLPGAFHGFDAFMPDAAISRRFHEAKVAALRRGLGLG